MELYTLARLTTLSSDRVVLLIALLVPLLVTGNIVVYNRLIYRSFSNSIIGKLLFYFLFAFYSTYVLR